MTRDFEEKLRRSLRDRAGDVSPDPAMFARVQSRIRRGRAVRFALAGVAGAFAITGVALAAPALMERRVEFRPPAVAEAPASPSEQAPSDPPSPTPRPVAATEVGPYVYTTGGGVLLSGTGLVLGAEDGVQSVAARPGSTPAGITLAVVERGDCGVVRYGFGGAPPPEVGEGVAPAPGTDVAVQDGCAATPVFSPDGGSLAWVAATEGGWTIQTVDWTATGPGDEDASFRLPWPADQPVELQEWEWVTQTRTEATGHLVFRTQRNGAWMLLQMPIERQADGALAVTLEPVPVVSDDGMTPVAFASSGRVVGDDPWYTMTIDQGPDGIEGGQIVRHVGSELGGVVDLPPELFDNGPAPFSVTDLWMSAAGDQLLYGNAQQRMAWSVDWSVADAPVVSNLEADGELLQVVHADLLLPATSPGPSDEPSEAVAATTQVDVFFGMAGAEACTADQPVQRQVAGEGVARGALTELLEGPTSRESNEGIETPFNANTAGALNDIEIVDGQARVDLRDFSGDVGTDACTKSAILDSLDKTLLQFPTISSTRYSFDGRVEAWESWLGSDTEHPAVPDKVAATADAILAAAQQRNFDALRRLSSETSCTLSDQKEPCVPFWKDQEANGEDPLGAMVDLLQGSPAVISGGGMWVWPPEFAAGGGYSGPRLGIDEDGVWRYFVLEGG